MGGGHGMGAEMELSLVAALQASSMPASLLQALRTLDQELGEETEREALHGVLDSLVEWFLHESRAPRTADGDDLGLCLRAACWLAPRFAGLSSSSNPRPHAADETSAALNDCSQATATTTATPETPAPGEARGDLGECQGQTTAARDDGEEPLQLLLELGAGRLGAGVDGIHKSLSLMAGALGPKSMRVRRAFASALRAHLSTVRVDSVFRFDAPKAGPSSGNGGLVSSPGRLALPPMLSWAFFRKYTVTMWVRLDPAHTGGDAATLFRFRNAEGVGVEATLSSPAAAATAGEQLPPPRGRREIVVTSFQRKSFSARCKFGPPAEAVHLGGGGAGDGGRQDGWRFVAVSHGQPYVKRSGRLRVSVDGGVVLDTELQYPPATGQGSKDPMSRCCFCEGFVGEAGSLALYGDELDMGAVRALLAAGPNHLGAAQPLPVATSDTLPPLLHTKMLSGQGAKAAASARLMAAFLPRMCTDGVCPAWRPGGTVDLHNVVMASPAVAMVQARGGSGGDLARLEGPVKHVVTYSGVHVAPGPATKGGVYDAWFRAGGTRALLYTAARVVDELADVASEASAKGASGQVRDRAEVLAREGRELLGELLRTVAVLLSSGPVHREEFLQAHGFHMLSTVLQRLPRPAQDLSGPVLGACLHLLHVVDAFQEVELLGAALQGVLLDFRLWSDAGVEAQALLLEGVSSVAERRVAQLRAFVGPQLLLDVLRVHVCTADRAPARAQKRSSTSTPPAAAAPSHAADGSVIARPVTPKSKRGSGFGDGSSGGGGGGGGGGAAGEPLERCVGACMRMLHAMLRSELSDDVQAASSFIEAAGGGDRAPGGALGSRGMDAIERAKYVRMSFLEEDFGGSFGLDGSGWKDGVLREAGVDGAVEDPGSAVAAAAAAGKADGVNAAVVCLQECQSPDLQRGVLGVLLGLRKDGPIKDFLRRELLRSMFLWEAAPILLSRKGYSTDVRSDCLALSLWLLTETHAAGDESSLAPSSKTPRHRRPSVSAFPANGGGNASSAPNLAKALDAENLVLREDGERGQGAADGGDAASGRDVLAAVREQYWSAHLMLARTVALAVSQGAWGTIPGPLSPAPAPIGQDVVDVALSGGQVSAATEETVGKTAAEGGGGGGGHNNDAGDAESGSSGGGGGGKRASLWLSLPFLAALLPGASPSTRQQAAMSINIALKGNVAARKALLRLSELSWADALMELALCERELDDPFAAGATGAAEGAASGGSLKRPSSSSGGGGWESVERFGDGAVCTPVGETSLCEELALDAAGCVVADSIVERPRGWTILRPLLASLDRAVVQRVGLDRGGQEWQRLALCKLSSTVLQRVARGSGRWTELTLDGLNKLMLLVEERLFPGDELAAAMAAAAAATAAAGGDSHQESGGGEAGGLGVVGAPAEGHLPVLGSSGGQSSFDMEGSWGEDGTAAGPLSHLVECMLEIVRGLRSMLSNEPLPATGHRAPVAAVAAAAAAAAGDVGLRTRACNALWPALRALGRVPVLRDVGTELSRVVYHEVFLSLQVLLSLPEVTPAAGKSATLETFLSLRKALSLCDEDLSRPDPSASGSAWGWGRRSTSWGRRKRANGPFDPDAAALAMEKRGLLGAVAMAAVQNLHTLPSAESAAAEDAAGDNAAETARGRRGETAGRPAPHQAKGGGAAAAAATTVTPKASAAVAEMLTGASGCEDMDEIFKSLSAVLAEAQAESRQDYADFVPLFRNMGSGRRGSSSSLSSSFNAGGRRPSFEYNNDGGGGGGGGARGGSAAVGGYASAHLPASYTMPFGLPPPLHRVRLSRDAGEFAWPAEPPGPHGPPRPYTPSSGTGEDAAAIAAAAAAGDSSPPDAAVVAAKALQHLPPRGSLIFGLGGTAAAESLAAAVLAEHRVVVEEEHLRLEYAMAALDAAGERARRHWRRVSRLAEAEAEASLWVGEEKGAAAAACRRAGGERLTGLYRDCRWKLAGNEHEGSEPGRYRPVLQPVLAAPSSSSSSASVVPAEDLSASTMSMEDVGLQLARKCSRYIVDIVKTEATGDALADAGGGGGGGGGNGDDNGDDNHGENEEDEEEDVWGVIGALSPAAGISGDPEAAAAGSSGTDEAAIVAAALDVVEEVSSTGESPLARAQREEDERHLVEARVRQTLAAVAGRQDGGAGPRVDLGPGAARWRMAVAIAAEAASGLGVTETVVLVTPKGNRRGRLSLVDKFLSFMPESATADGDGGRDGGGGGGGGGGTSSGAGAAKAYTWAVDQVERVRKRRYRLRESALEVFLRRGKRRSLFVDFGSESRDQGRRNDFIRALETRCPSGSSESSDASRLLKAWQRRRISNFEYLMGLNTLAGRSFNDLCQYPVFPWVLSDYTSDELDLSDDKVFRDLKKPMGAVNPERLAEFIDRYRSFDDPDIPSFMYGSHYSTAVGVVLHYLVRLQPFAELHREMQNGTFDVADRLFSSVARSWDMCTSALSEVKELTPEWYSLPDFLTNVNGFAFGKAQDGTEINDVQLPPWAGGPADFILKHRAALESDYVSQNLHHWIDLIFGYKQRGPAAEKAHNVFYYLTYSGAVDLANIQDEGLRRATELQIAHFGQCPAQLFGRPHPARGQRGQGVPRPVAASFRGLERWRESSRLASVRSVQRVPSVSLKQVGVRACRALADGRLLSVNGLGVIEQFNYAWRDWQLAAEDSSAVAATTATGAETAAEGEEEEEEEEERVVGDDSEGEPGVEAKSDTDQQQQLRSGSSTGGGGGGSSNSPPRQRRRRRTQNNRPPVASGICVERRMVHFTHVPRIPLGARPAVDSRGEEASGGPVDWPPPLPAPPVCFSPSGRYLFSGGHESGALLMWQFDYDNTGQVCGEMALHGHSAPVTCLALCGLEAKDSDLVLSGAADGTALLWSVRRLAPNYISDSLRRPTARRCPALVVRGHGGPVTACAVSDGLGLALTCSDGRALLTAIEGNVLLRALGQQPAGSSVGGGGRGGVLTPAAAVDGGGESASGGGGGGGGGGGRESSAALPQQQQQQLPAARYTACALGETGYCALASSRLAAGDEPGAAAAVLLPVHELEVYTVNGLLTARVSGLSGAVRCLSTAGRGELLVVGGDGLMLEVRTMASLAPVWSLDPGSWVTIDCFSGAGGGGGVPRGAARGAGAATTPDMPPSVECVELGPNPNAPVLVCVGTSDGSLLVQALPDAEEWLRNNLIVAVGSMIISAPGKVLKGTVNTVHSIATKSIRGAGGLVNTTGDIAKEVVGEVGTLAKGVRRAGLIRGVLGYWNRDEGGLEEEQGREA